jgi:hypothetical protein
MVIQLVAFEDVDGFHEPLAVGFSAASIQPHRKLAQGSNESLKLISTLMST